jgi:hypothetical protein
MKPLYDHTTEATAYVVDDYPYGFTARTSIRYWLEYKAKKGWRFVSQTKNPKTGAWNKPKMSTYTEWGAAMYLDENNHVQWTGIGQYSDDQTILTFVTTFPNADMHELRKIAPLKQRYLAGSINGTIVTTINNVRQPVSEADIERLQNELATWKQIEKLIEGGVS